MADMIKINVITDKKYTEPRVDIYTNGDTDLASQIVEAVEKVAKVKYPPIQVLDEGKLILISQRDIFRIRTEGRALILDTKDKSYTVKGTISGYEEELDNERFFRSSQSEIINLYKVAFFDFSITGTVGVEFENGTRSWVSRRNIKQLKSRLKGESDIQKNQREEV